MPSLRLRPFAFGWNLRLGHGEQTPREFAHLLKWRRVALESIRFLSHTAAVGDSSSCTDAWPFLKPRTNPTPPPPPASASTLIASRRSWSLLANNAYPIRAM